MPATVEAALLLALLYAPGFLLTRGYLRGRTHAAPERDLYAVAQSIVASVFVLAVAWLLGADVVSDWIRDGAVAKHESSILWIVIAVLGGSYVAGRVVGASLDWVSARPWLPLARTLARLGVGDPPTAWEAAWNRAQIGEWAVVTVGLRDGSEITGLFAGNSSVDLSPNPRQVYLEAEYRWQNGRLETVPGEGIFIDGSEIVTVRFETYGPSQSD